MITSSTPGRLRVRQDALREAAYADQLVGALSSIGGIESLHLNPELGSLLVRFDPEATDNEVLWAALGERPGEDTSTWNSGRMPRARPVQLALNISLGLMVGALFIGRKRLHVAAGVAFLAATGAHLYRNHQRRTAHAAWANRRKENAS